MANAGMISLPPRAATSVTIAREPLAVIVGLVKAIAVGRFDQQDVGLARPASDREGPVGRSGRGRRQTGSSSRPTADARVRRAEQMARVDEIDLDARSDRNRAVVADRLQPLERPGGIDLRVERQRRAVLRVVVPVRLARVLFLNVRRVGQHQRAEIPGARRAEHASPKALRDEPRQIAAVIEVRVRQDDRIDPRRIDRKRCPVALPQLLETLKEAAVDENPTVAESRADASSRSRCRRRRETSAMAARVCIV